MNIRFAIRLLAWVSGALACMAAWAGEVKPPIQGADIDSSNISQQHATDWSTLPGSKPPVIDDVKNQGIRLPEENEDTKKDESKKEGDAPIISLPH